MKEKELLQKYLPTSSINVVMNWIINNNIHLKITKKRSTKLGDYRPPGANPNHRISINHNLNPYSFLITFIHELAHLIVWEKHRNTVSPHGIEWKNECRILMEITLKERMFPDDIEKVLKSSIINSKASSSTDLNLSRILKKYDSTQLGASLEDLDKDTIFETESGLKFKKGNKRRTRYICQNLQNNKLYLFHPLTIVQKVVLDVKF
jgi:SprT protein